MKLQDVITTSYTHNYEYSAQEIVNKYISIETLTQANQGEIVYIFAVPFADPDYKDAHSVCTHIAKYIVELASKSSITMCANEFYNFYCTHNCSSKQDLQSLYEHHEFIYHIALEEFTKNQALIKIILLKKKQSQAKLMKNDVTILQYNGTIFVESRVYVLYCQLIELYRSNQNVSEGEVIGKISMPTQFLNQFLRTIPKAAQYHAHEFEINTQVRVDNQIVYSISNEFISNMSINIMWSGLGGKEEIVYISTIAPETPETIWL